MWHKLLWLGLAGALGALGRYGLSSGIQRLQAGGLAAAGPPLGTLVVNVLGCFLFGLAWTALEDRFPLSGELRGVVLIGFLGSFTTFSTYAFETGRLIQSGHLAQAAFVVTAHTVLGIVALFAGLIVGRAV